MKSSPIRMCILCRNRLGKCDLLRLQCKNQEIINYAYEARSFYLCFNCANNQAKVSSKVKKIFKTNNIKLNFIIT